MNSSKQKKKFISFFVFLLSSLLILYISGCEATLTPDEKYCTVMFDTDNGNNISPVSVKTGDCVVEPDVPEKEGFVFEGWYTDTEYSVKYDFNTNSYRNSCRTSVL